MTPELGIVEGFYGRNWGWDARRAVMRLLQPHGYSFYHYAPKGDAYLRRQWQAPYPAEEAAELARFATECRVAKVRFGIGLSPYEIWSNFDGAAQTALADRLALFADLGADDIGLLFDDMQGDRPDLAERQAEVVDFARAHTGAARLIVCPSYYSDDSVLDRVFGARPDRYLETLGAQLAPEVEIFWTGEEVCSRAFSPGHLARVTAQLGRKPFLWDNYPVNDGPRMSPHLHLRGFTGRPAGIAPHIAAHAINPALQPMLSCIPAITLAMSYAQGDAYQYAAAFLEAARAVAGPEIAAMLQADLLGLQDAGLDGMTAERKAKLRAKYAAVDHACAREVVEWLDGRYGVSAEEVATQ
ncbi:beta-N-acetylglucosaminidase domain-containing protein [Sphingoaurantiacus capsulatus]|uniref:Beta-N-acetylglucosaminidase domain-containing protein n=1 Tax=Sphingoaurantiacus capsulatus TaxID=1771310 RepID=A0ABV7XHG0_9SPHN